MTSRDFCFWLQGFFEIQNAGATPPDRVSQRGLLGEEAVCIQKHLSLVFKHEIDPSMGDKALQDTLNAMHKEARPRC